MGKVIMLGVPALLILLIWAMIAGDAEERRLIESGACKADAEAWYQPPPTMVCSAYNSNGTCMIMIPIQSDPYLRTHWSCGDQDFWRQKDN